MRAEAQACPNWSLSACSPLCADGSPEPSDPIITYSGRVWRPVCTNTVFNNLIIDLISSLSVYASQTHQNQQAIISESVNLDSSGLKSLSNGYHLGAPPSRRLFVEKTKKYAISHDLFGNCDCQQLAGGTPALPGMSWKQIICGIRRDAGASRERLLNIRQPLDSL